MVNASMFLTFWERNFYHNVYSKTYFSHTFYSTRFSLRELGYMVSFVNKFNLNTKNGITTLTILPANIGVQDINRKLPKCLLRFFFWLSYA